MHADKPAIIVVGSGIVGAAIAYNLARRGAAVILLDKGRPGAGVTGKAFAWINVSHGIPEPYSQLRHLAIEEYRRLEHDLAQSLRVDWCGAMTWRWDIADTQRFAQEHAAWGYDVRIVERDEIARLEPNLIQLPVCAAYAANEGALDPMAATEILVHEARRAGAEVRLASEVVALTAHGDRITGVRTAQETLAADWVVLAAGTGTGALCKPLGLQLPVETSPAVLVRLQTAGRLANGVISSPEFEIRQASESCLLVAEDYIDDSDENGPDAIAHRTTSVLKERLRGGDGVTLKDVTVGLRPIPNDGLPIVGLGSGIEGLYVAVMHAGVTLAPIIGRLAATEILDGVALDALQLCRLERFA
jgi:glycine/D-amino acid oxidase-like deaminating enzyme